MAGRSGGEETRLAASPRRTVVNIALLGCMAAGKTSVGRALAQALSWRFVDADAELAERAGCSIPEIFASEGEQGFRDRESAVLRDLVQGTEQVIACGGGVVLRPANTALLRQRCWLVLLWASPRTLAQRILNDPAARPVLGVGSGPRDLREVYLRLEEVLAVREPLYRAAADQILVTDELPPERLADVIARQWQKRSLHWSPGPEGDPR